MLKEANNRLTEFEIRYETDLRDIISNDTLWEIIHYQKIANTINNLYFGPQFYITDIESSSGDDIGLMREHLIQAFQHRFEIRIEALKKDCAPKPILENFLQFTKPPFNQLKTPLLIMRDTTDTDKLHQFICCYLHNALKHSDGSLDDAITIYNFYNQAVKNILGSELHEIDKNWIKNNEIYGFHL